VAVEPKLILQISADGLAMIGSDLTAGLKPFVGSVQTTISGDIAERCSLLERTAPGIAATRAFANRFRPES
jgi:hypothetical protein